MDLTDSSADWISQFDYSGHGWEDEIPSFHSSMLLQDSHGDCGERAAKILKTNSSSSSTSANLHQFSGGSGVISFGSSPPFDQTTQLHQLDAKPPKLEPVVSGNQLVGFVEGPTAHGSDAGRWRRGSGGGGGGCNIGMKEHVIAERKRREKLSQRFISLSSLLPELKKMDKASVLGEAARYVKQLQEQVKTLEEDHKSSKRVVESVVVARSPKINYSSIEDGNMSSSSTSSIDNVESSSSGDHHLLPEIEARFSNKDVLLRVLCTRNQGIVPKVLDEIQKLRLSIVNCNSMPFGQSTMVVTVVAEMNDEFSTSMELVNMIRQSLQTLT